MTSFDLTLRRLWLGAMAALALGACSGEPQNEYSDNSDADYDADYDCDDEDDDCDYADEDYGAPPPPMPGDRSSSGQSGGGQSWGKPGKQAAKGPSRGLPQGAIRLVPTGIMDNSGFGQPVLAATMLVPSNWETKGGVDWGNQYRCVHGYAFSWSAIGANNTEGVAILPNEGWEWTTNDGGVNVTGCPRVNMFTVDDYLRAIVPRVRPDARIVEIRPRPDLVQDLSAMAGQQQVGQMVSVTQPAAAEAVITFTENGVPIRGVLVSAVVFNENRTTVGVYDTPFVSGRALTLPTYAAWGPEGKFSPGMAEAIRKTFREGPVWSQLIARHNQIINQGQIETYGKISQIQAQGAAEVNQIIMQGQRASSAAFDYSAREVSEMIRGVETYNDSSSATGQVELNNAYDQAWRLSDGSYVLTNDAGFAPFRDLGIDGERLNVSR